MPSSDPSRFLVAHRGDAAGGPENTIPAVAAALAAGARYVEFDVQLTMDAEPVVTHDERLTRTAGLDRSVHEMTRQELSTVLVVADGGPGVGIPSLAEMVELVAGAPAATAFVELKRASLRHFGRSAMIERVHPLLAALTPRAVVISYDAEVLREARDRFEMPIGWVLERCDDASRVETERLAPAYLFADRRTLPDNDRPLWAGTWTWVVFDVDDPADARRLTKRGVTLFETRTFAATAAAFREAGP